MAKLLIEIEKTKKGEFKFSFVKNGKHLCGGKGYNRKASARKTIESIRKAFAEGNFEIVDKTK